MPRVLQVGAGGFGRVHLQAWLDLGYRESLWVAELSPERRAWAAARGIPADRLGEDFRRWLDQADVVDIVTATDTHAPLCREALAAGKDVFIEKPMTMTAEDARLLAALAEQTSRLIQVGYYYRFHPISQHLKRELDAGRFGAVRYITGNFCGFKRARTDVGVTHTDGIHFLDLFSWLLGRPPVEVYAVCRDHFRRGLEDFSVVLLTYPGGAVGKVESGYIQPGRWKDRVVPGALTTKEITIVGEQATATADFEAETLTWYDVRQEFKNQTWTPVIGETRQPTPFEPCGPVALVARELSAFLGSVQARRPTLVGPVDGGVNLAVLMEGLYASAARGRPVRLDGTAPAAPGELMRIAHG